MVTFSMPQSAELLRGVGEARFDLDPVGLVAEHGGHAGTDAKTAAPLAEHPSERQIFPCHVFEDVVERDGIAGDEARDLLVLFGFEQVVDTLFCFC